MKNVRKAFTNVVTVMFALLFCSMAYGGTNTATGTGALAHSTADLDNTADGYNALHINKNGDWTDQLGTLTSSEKFKKNIHDMGQASDALMSLRPVTFQYKLKSIRAVRPSLV